MVQRKAIAFVLIMLFVFEINLCFSQTKEDSDIEISYWHKTDSLDSIASNLSSLAFGYWEANFLIKSKETYKKAIAIRIERNEYEKLKSLYTSLGLIYLSLEQSDSALIALKNGYDVSRRFNDKTEIISGMIIIALAYERLEQYDKAIEILIKAEKISKEINNTKYLKDCYLHLSSNYFLISDDLKTLQYLRLYDSVSKLISIGNIIIEDTLVCVNRYKLDKELLIQNNDELKILNDFYSNELIESKYIQYELKRKNSLNSIFLIFLIVFSIVITFALIILFIIYKRQKSKVDYLKLSEEKFRMFYEYCTTPFLLLKDNRVVECNYATKKRFGFYNDLEFINEPFEKFLAKTQFEGTNMEDLFHIHIDKVNKIGHSAGEFLLIDADEKEVWMHLSFSLLNFPNNNFIFLIFTDIDELRNNYLSTKKRKEELENKMQFKLRELTKKLNVSEKIQKIFKFLYFNLNYNLQKEGLNNEILSTFQIKNKYLNLGLVEDNLKIEKNDIYDLLTEIKSLCDDLIADNDVELEIIKKENVTDSVWLDKDKILFVVEAIIKNCIENTVDFSKIVFTVYNKVNCLYFSISDNGKKITDEQTESFFYTQYSTSYEGRSCGLELVLANQYILNHGGNILIVNNKTEGVTFILSLNECCTPD